MDTPQVAIKNSVCNAILKFPQFMEKENNENVTTILYPHPTHIHWELDFPKTLMKREPSSLVSPMTAIHPRLRDITNDASRRLSSTQSSHPIAASTPNK
jgi:hypothetical protein